MFKQYIGYLLLILLYITNMKDSYKIFKNTENKNYKISTLINKISSLILLILFTIYYKKFLMINLKEIIVLTSFYTLNSLLGISTSPSVINLLSLLKIKKKYIFILTLIGLFSIIFISNYCYIKFLQYIFSLI